jgi:beta-glucosidase-like glycosyl hydrolase
MPAPLAPNWYCFIEFHGADLAIGAQVCRDPRWGRCYESYSEDHKIVQAMTELIPGLQGDVPQNFTSGMPYVAGK